MNQLSLRKVDPQIMAMRNQMHQLGAYKINISALNEATRYLVCSFSNNNSEAKVYFPLQFLFDYWFDTSGLPDCYFDNQIALYFAREMIGNEGLPEEYSDFEDCQPQHILAGSDFKNYLFACSEIDDVFFNQIPVHLTYQIKTYDVGSIPIQLRFCLGQNQLSSRQLSVLRKNDIVMIEGQAIFTANNGSFKGNFHLNENKIELENFFNCNSDEAIMGTRNIDMIRKTNYLQNKLSVMLQPGDLPHEITFELNQFRLTLNELQHLRQHSSLILPDRQKIRVLLTIAEQVIAYGNLIKINDRYAVEIEKNYLNDNTLKNNQTKLKKTSLENDENEVLSQAQTLANNIDSSETLQQISLQEATEIDDIEIDDLNLNLEISLRLGQRLITKKKIESLNHGSKIQIKLDHSPLNVELLVADFKVATGELINSNDKAAIEINEIHLPYALDLSPEITSAIEHSKVDVSKHSAFGLATDQESNAYLENLDASEKLALLNVNAKHDQLDEVTSVTSEIDFLTENHIEEEAVDEIDDLVNEYASDELHVNEIENNEIAAEKLEIESEIEEKEAAISPGIDSNLDINLDKNIHQLSAYQSEVDQFNTDHLQESVFVNDNAVKTNSTGLPQVSQDNTASMLDISDDLSGVDNNDDSQEQFLQLNRSLHNQSKNSIDDINSNPNENNYFPFLEESTEVLIEEAQTIEESTEVLIEEAQTIEVEAEAAIKAVSDAVVEVVAEETKTIEKEAKEFEASVQIKEIESIEENIENPSEVKKEASNKVVDLDAITSENRFKENTSDKEQAGDWQKKLAAYKKSLLDKQ